METVWIQIGHQMVAKYYFDVGIAMALDRFTQLELMEQVWRKLIAKAYGEQTLVGHHMEIK